jgi:hypothetical protein
MANLKLYIWEDVLRDYTPGMVAVLAESEEQAWELIKQKDEVAWYSLLGYPSKEDIAMGCPDAIRPREITKPEAFTVHGGG